MLCEAPLMACDDVNQMLTKTIPTIQAVIITSARTTTYHLDV